MKLDPRPIFRKINGCDPSEIRSCVVDRGAENRGIIFHDASYSVNSDNNIWRVVEKKTVRKKETLVAGILREIQSTTTMCSVFPKIYCIKSKGKVTSIFMEYVESVDDTFLREEGSVELITSALLELSVADLKPLGRPRKTMHIMKTLFEVLSILTIVKFTYIEKWSLFKLSLISMSAMMRLPVILSHGDLSLQNMAYNKSTHELRFIDFGSVHYNFAASDLKNLFRCRDLLEYDFYELTKKYALSSGCREKDLMVSVWLADLRRCALRIQRARRRKNPATLNREKRAFKAILTEFELKFRQE